MKYLKAILGNELKREQLPIIVKMSGNSTMVFDIVSRLPRTLKRLNYSKGFLTFFMKPVGPHIFLSTEALYLREVG